MLTGISDVPIASIIFSPKCIRDGTMIKPPPIPKYPADRPTRNPIVSCFTLLSKTVILFSLILE